MGAIAAEANFWARIRDNQPPPDSQARVRFLLDEIALLQSRFQGKDYRSGKFEAVERGDGSESSLSKEKEEIVSLSIETKTKEPMETVDRDEDTAIVEESDQGEEILVKALEDRVRNVLDEQVWFFEKAEKELRPGKVERVELETLIQLEKAKLQRHKSELESLRKKIQYSTIGAATHALDILGKLGYMLDERETFHAKFEALVELGNPFRILKLVELQKAKHEVSRRGVETCVQDYRGHFQRLGSDERTETVSTDMEIKEQTLHNERDGETELAELVSGEGESCSENGTTENNIGLYRHAEDSSSCQKEAKSEILKLMTKQEQQWKAQQAVLKEMERRIELSELESVRLRNRLAEGVSGGCSPRTATFSWTASLPQGYSSIYFSPIFQERKPSVNPAKEDKGADIFKLKTEIDELKSLLYRKRGDEEKFLDRIQVPSEEKTISIDKGQLTGISKHFANLQSDSSRSQDVSVCSEDDKRSSVDAWETKSTSTASHLHVKISEMEEEIQSLKAENSRAADEYAQQLDIKEKTLAYAQALNARLANDMTSAENALAELRAEHTGLKTSIQSKLKDSKKEAEELANELRKTIKLLEKEVIEKDKLLRDTNSRLDACRRETDAAVLEKNEIFKRLQQVVSEKESQSRMVEAREKMQSQLLSELEEARNDLKAEVNEHETLADRYTQLQSKLLETEYQLSQREEALERLTLHLAASAFQEQRQKLDDSSRESLRSKHGKRERARRSIQEVEDKMASMAAEMSRAKLEMEELKSQSFQLLTRTSKSSY